MSSYTKERNIYNIVLDNGRKYSLDVNTGVLTSGSTKKQLVGTPAGMQAFLYENRTQSLVFQYVRSCISGQAYTGGERRMGTLSTYALYASNLQMFDLIDSNANAEAVRNSNTVRSILSRVSDYTEENQRHTFIKQFLSWVNTTVPNNDNVSIEAYIKVLKAKETAKQFPKVKVTEHFTQDMYEWWVTYVERSNNAFPQSYYERLPYFLERGLYKFSTDGNINLNACINKFFDYARKLGLAEIDKGDFTRLYVQYKETYELNKEKIENTSIENYQTEKLTALQFEDDNFQVVVPMTVSEIKAEAEAQSNCVYRFYAHRLVDGETHIVFVRKKNCLDQSYITCEVTNTGHIRQYLLAHNGHPEYDREKYAAEMDFYEAYQNHLREQW